MFCFHSLESRVSSWDSSPWLGCVCELSVEEVGPRPVCVVCVDAACNAHKCRNILMAVASEPEQKTPTLMRQEVSETSLLDVPPVNKIICQLGSYNCQV